MNVEGLRRRLHSAETIYEIVHAMRAVAAGRIQSAQRAAAAADRYYEIVLRSLCAVPVATAPRAGSGSSARKVGLLVFGSEQPLCGALTQNIVELAERRRREILSQRELLLMVVGRRAVRQFALRNITPDVFEPGTTSLAGLRDVVKRLAGTLAARYASGDLAEVIVVYSRYVAVSSQVPTVEQLLPPDLPALRKSAADDAREYAHYMSSEDLLESLIAEYVFIALYRMAAQMVTSEQAARLVAMDAATRSAERLLTDLRLQKSRAHQEKITAGVLELIAARLASARQRATEQGARAALP